jgi:nucleoside-diphosphate-sugar epimerase
MTPRISRAIVLGASGFIGGALVRSLAAGGLPVVAHSSRTLDLTRPEAFAVLDGTVGPDTALVLAAALTPDRGQTVETLLTNLAMVGNLGRYLAAHPVGHWTYLSSDAVYGFDANPVLETTPVAPGGYYALAKYGGEKLAEYAAAAAGIPALILRLTAVYGPGDPHGAYGPNAFARSLARDRTIRLFGDGEEERDHLYVEDAAGLAAALLRAGQTGVFNLATGESRSFGEVVTMIRGLLPHEVTVTSLPRKGAITHRRFDLSRLRRAVPGFAFTPFKDGLRATLEAVGAWPRA